MMYKEYFEEEVKRVTKEMVKYAEDKNYKYIRYSNDYLKKLINELRNLKDIE